MSDDAKHLGLGVMIAMLGGNRESAEAMQAALGKEITALRLDDGDRDNALHFTFSDGSGLRLFDDGQSCCESRYMRTDDDLSAFVGATLVSAEVRDVPKVPSEDEYGDEHEVQFLIVTTSKGAFTMASHNEHNGYYGGFAIRAAVE
jgi:hypothetical protein